MLKDHAEDLMNAVRQKNIELRILCGSEDKDCLPMAEELYESADREGIRVEFFVQKGSRHQFSTESAI